MAGAFWGVQFALGTARNYGCVPPRRSTVELLASALPAVRGKWINALRSVVHYIDKREYSIKEYNALRDRLYNDYLSRFPQESDLPGL